MHVLLAFSAVLALVAQGRAAPAPCNTTSDKLGAVACESAICSEIGVNILKGGGNAADAMVATLLCVGVVAPYHSGIGGGGFMLVRAANGSYEYIDFRETMPAAGFQDMYNHNLNASLYGGMAAGVPGELRGLEHLHNNYGKLSWAAVVQPAIDVAFNGFPVNPDTVRYFKQGTAGFQNFLVQDPNWAIDFAPNGTLLGLGDTLTRRRYAATLATIAKHGANAFYTGAVANATIQALKAATPSGIMTLEDLANYTVAIQPPLSISYRDYKITSTSAPSSGEILLSVMKTVEGYSGFGDPANINISTHRLDEAIRFGYGERTLMGDPDFITNLNIYQTEIINDTTAAMTRAKISDEHTLNTSAYNPNGFITLTDHGTSHVVTADSTGLTVSLTSTVNTLFGSLVLVPSTGIILNNQMNDFSIPNTTNAFGYIASPNNYVRAHKRPLSSISATIVEFAANNSMYFATGTAGGSRIITSTIQSLWNVLDKGMTAQEAVAAPRFHDQLTPNVWEAERSYDNGTVAFMKSRGHNVTRVAQEATAVQCLRRRWDGGFEAGAEPRQVAAGGFVV